MRRSKSIRLAVAFISLQLVCFGATASRTKKPVTPTSIAHARKTFGHKSTHSRSAAARKPHVRGQAAPRSDRTREIQTALIREHYLNGEPSGSWDDQTRSALTKYQADHGWQSKVVPDSRALIKLGLGPSREGLLNPDTAVMSPHELGAENPQPGGSASN